jgi:hypothetical protein
MVLQARLSKQKKKAEAPVKALEAESHTENLLTAIEDDVDKIMKSDLPLDEYAALLSPQFENLKGHKKTAGVIEEKRDMLAGKAAQLEAHVYELTKEKKMHEKKKIKLQNEFESESHITCKRASCWVISKTVMYLSVNTQLNKSSCFCHSFYFSIIQCSYYRYDDETTTCFDLIRSS